MNAVVVADPPSRLGPKDPGEANFYQFDFTAWISNGESIQSAVVTSTDTDTNQDSSSSMVYGSATIMGTSLVQQLIKGGVLFHRYRLQCAVATNQGETFVLSAILPIEYIYGVAT